MRMRTARRRPLALALLAVMTMGLAVVSGQAEAQVVVKTRAGDVSGPVFGSAVFGLPFAASHLAVHWAGNPEAEVTMATSTDGVTFGAATDVALDEVGEHRGDGESYGAVLPAGGATSVRLTSDRPLGRATVLALADGERVATYEPVPARPAGADVAQPEIISRSGWEADESLRFRGKREIWPPEFSPVQKTIVHHTAGANDDANPEQTIRAIYYYHAVTQRWGDIGYHFLISDDGRIFKGRHSHPPNSSEDTITGENAAGEVVTAGHAYQHNVGTIGVALLGNFVGVAPDPRARAALVEFLAWKMDVHEALEPEDTTSIYANPVNGVTKPLPDIAGHLDANFDTECPGGFLYDDLGPIRTDVRTYMDDRVGVTTTTSTTPSTTTTTIKRRKP